MNKEKFIKKIKEINATVPNEYFFLEYNKCVCDILEENQKYKAVIDKAVEYIEKHLTDNGRFLMLNEWQVPDLFKLL